MNLNDQIVKQAALMIPQIRKEASIFVKQSQAQPQAQQPADKSESFFSKLTNPDQYFNYLQQMPAFKNLMDTASKKTTELLTQGPAKQKVSSLIQNTLLPQVHQFLQQNKQKLPIYVVNNNQFVDDFTKTLDKEKIIQGIIQAISKDSALISSIVSITRPIFSSVAQKKSSTSNGMQKKAFVPLLAVALAEILDLGIAWFVRYMVMHFLYWFASNALWPMIKATLVAVGSYLIYDYFKKSFGEWGSKKDLQSILPFAWQSGTQVATYEALEHLADQKSFEEVQKIVKEMGKTKYKIPDNVEQELLATRDKEHFKQVLDKHKNELTTKIEETVGSNPGFAGLDPNGIMSKIFSLFGNYNNIFGLVLGVLGGLLMSKVLF